MYLGFESSTGITIELQVFYSKLNPELAQKRVIQIAPSPLSSQETLADEEIDEKVKPLDTGLTQNEMKILCRGETLVQYNE